VITKNQSLLVLGSPGTGKTTLLQGITERLRSLSKTVEIISKTHCASARAGGCTADHWIRKKVINGSCSADFLWIDEISQLDCELIAALNRLTYTNVRFLISGDFNQFAPIGNSFRGSVVEDSAFERSNLLHRMADGNRLVLTECKRSDAELFDFYTRLIPGGDLYDQSIEEAVKLARDEFIYEGVCDLNFVLSHRKRIAINRRVNLHKKPHDAVFLPCPKLKRLSLNAPQEMWIWPGLELLGCLPIEKQGVRNGVLYKIESITEDTVHFEGGISLSKEDCVQLMRLSHAMTYASVQGRETDGSLALFDCTSPHFTHKHLYVALSRAKKADYVKVQTDP
jgi:ATP-dependent exoDNAse (exonuclease V) alpha subunit